MFKLARIFPGLPETERGRPFVLNVDPKGKKIVYGVANSVIIRDIEDPTISEMVTHHSRKVTCAVYAPSGFYICSGDASGSVKIWDTVGDERIIKYEYSLVGGNIYDISWSEDSKRIAVVGEGRDKYGCVVAWDTGTNIGAISGNTKTVLTVDFKKCRPYGIVTAGEDQTVLHHKGPPFKYDKIHKDHTNFVNCARFSKDGAYAASAGSDGKIIVYDGKTLDKICELVAEGKDKAHDGGIYSISWSPCSTKLLSASADKTCKIWKIQDKTCENVFKVGTELPDQQLGCVWVNPNLFISLSFSGRLNFYDPTQPEKPLKTYWGHNKGIVSVAISPDKKSLLTGSYDGNFNHWNIASGECVPIAGPKFSNQVTHISVHEDEITAVGVGKIIRYASLSKKEFLPETTSTETDPLCSTYITKDTIIVGCNGTIDLIVGKKNVSSIQVGFDVLSAVEVEPNLVAFCGTGKDILFVKISGNNIALDSKKIAVGAPLTKLAVTKDKKYLLASAASKSCYLFNLSSLAEEQKWTAQSNRVNCIDFSDNDEYIATCGIDGSVNIYKPHDRNYTIEIRLAHRMYNCGFVYWTGPSSVVSVGQQDCSIKFWDLTL